MKKLFIVVLFFIVTSSNAQVRGVWVTNVASDALRSREKIKECVQICKAAGLTDIFMVAYNNAKTLYKSKVMKALVGYEIDSIYGSRDPLQEMIEEAHKENIRVHAWFEFGFSSSYNANGGILVKKKPHWAAKTSDGKLVTKNKFDWLNCFYPEVQNYIKSLLLEVAKKYDVDGVQGDDRLPANPSTAGYDNYTVNLYKKQHKGKIPPANYKDSAWVQWRSNLLTDFLGKLYKELKAQKPNLIVSMAPSIYPWSKEEYLQDWPTWVKKGYVDLVFPQVYRYNFEAYKSALSAISKQLTPKEKTICYPGVLQSLGNGHLTNDSLMEQVIIENRKQGFAGEVFFYFNGIQLKQEWFSTNYNKLNSENKVSTSISTSTQQLINNIISKSPTPVHVLYINEFAIFTGITTKDIKLKLQQLMGALKVNANATLLKTDK